MRCSSLFFIHIICSLHFHYRQHAWLTIMTNCLTSLNSAVSSLHTVWNMRWIFTLWLYTVLTGTLPELSVSSVPGHKVTFIYKLDIYLNSHFLGLLCALSSYYYFCPIGQIGRSLFVLVDIKLIIWREIIVVETKQKWKRNNTAALMMKFLK